MRPRLSNALVSLRSPSSFAAEQYQALRLRVEQLRRERDLRVIAISSPGLGDGKTVTAINLATAHAESDRVLLVDADLRRPSVGTQLGIEDSGAPGLANALTDKRIGLEHVVRRNDTVPFSIVLGGTPSAPVHELLRSSRLDVLLREARRQFDLVLIDTPPLIPVTDAAVLARAVDGVLIVISANVTPRKLLEESLNLLEPSKVAGIVFNRDHRPLYGYYQGDYRSRFPGRPPGTSAA
jgi:capsular exopolysaccharide synthesis family protein